MLISGGSTESGGATPGGKGTWDAEPNHGDGERSDDEMSGHGPPQKKGWSRAFHA